MSYCIFSITDFLEKKTCKHIGNSLYLNNLAEAQLSTGDLYEAEKTLKHSLKVDQKGMLTYFILGRLYKVQKKNEESITAFNKSLVINPELLDAQFEIAEIQFGKHEKEKAEKSIGKALSKDPANSKYKKLLDRIQSS